MWLLVVNTSHSRTVSRSSGVGGEKDGGRGGATAAPVFPEKEREREKDTEREREREKKCLPLGPGTLTRKD